MQKVFIAKPYTTNCMSSLGKASGVIIRQHNFPFEYDEILDKIWTNDYDRVIEQKYSQVILCIKRHIGTGELEIENWVRNSSVKKIISFFVDFLQALTDIKYNGFRILGSVNRSNGYIVYTIQLFYKHPDSKTKTYSEDYNVPNVDKQENIYNFGYDYFDNHFVDEVNNND